MSHLPQPGDVFARHRIEAELGRGGMGVVYRARSLSLDRVRALKVIAPGISADEVFAARFRREARLAASVEHPHVVQVFHAGEEEGLLYLVSRLVEGPDLGELLADGPLEPARAVSILRAIASALDAAHAGGLIHRDVKPANILLEQDGEEEFAYLTDFGISKEVDVDTHGASAATAVTRGHELLGTADYVAPEQVEGKDATSSGDVYSLGCVAFQMFAGSPPFSRDSELATLVAHTKAPRPSARRLNPDLPATLDDALAAGMAIDPAQRPGTATDLAERIEGALGKRQVLRFTRPRPSRRWQRMVLAGLGVAAFAAATLGVVSLLSGESSAPSSPADDPTAPDAPADPTVRVRDVGPGPLGVAVGDRVWVASRDADALYRLRRSRFRRAGGAISVPSPVAVAVGFNSIWAVSTEGLYRVRQDREGEPIRIGAGIKPSSVAVGDRWVWVGDEDGDTVARVNPATNEVDATIAVPDEPRAVVFGGGSVWVACAGAGVVVRIDPAQAERRGRAVRAGSRPTAITSGAGAIWVTDNARGQLRKIDARSGRQLGRPVATEPKPRGVDVGLGAVWVASGQGGAVQRFDPETLASIGDPIPVGPDPADVAVGPRAVYTANFDGPSATQVQP